MRIANRPDPSPQYMTADGRLTLEGQKLFANWVEVMREQRAEIVALQARVTALEP